MNVNANELNTHMNNHDLKKIAVEVVDVNVPKIDPPKGGWVNQPPRVMAKRIIVLSIQPGNNTRPPKLYYAMYNSFNKGSGYVPNDFMFNVLVGAEQNDIINEYEEHLAGLEKAFRDAFNLVHEDIQLKLDAAHQLIKEAESLSNEHGVPFSPRAELFPCEATYVPNTFTKKFGNTPEVYAVMNELTGVNDAGSTGWDGAWNNSSEQC